MGTSRSSVELVRKLNDLGTATQRKAKNVVDEGALAAKTIMLATAASKGVTPGRKIGDRKWGVRYDVKGTTNPTALVRFTGPFHLVNNPTDPHIIGARRLGTRGAFRARQRQLEVVGAFSGRSSRGGFSENVGMFGALRGQSDTRRNGLVLNRQRAKALKFGSSHYAYVFHPGTPGKRIFEAAKVVAERRVPKVMAARQMSIWGQVMS